MREIRTYAALEKFGRQRLSRHFFMRDFLYTEIGNFHGVPNLPGDPALAIAAGQRLCQDLLDPLFETFGQITIRSSYRSPTLNRFGNERGLNCARNEANYAGHIWDQRDRDGRMGATTCVSIPWFADQYEAGRDWRDLAWWIHDHLPYGAMFFYPWRAAFNLNWSEVPARSISSFIAPKGRLLAAGAEPADPIEARQDRYADFPSFRAIAHPKAPERPDPPRPGSTRVG